MNLYFIQTKESCQFIMAKNRFKAKNIFRVSFPKIKIYHSEKSKWR